ncbi:MAG: patatin-like phospholipase family protein [Thermodesulfobacteriota bacterium]
MSDNLSFLAGTRALNLIRDGGLGPDQVKIMAGAAGGPKWLVLGHLDRVVFGHWLKPRPRPLFLVGSSIGAWRFAAAGQARPVEAIDRFEAGYLDQFYSAKPDLVEIARECLRVRDAYLDDKAIREILGHPFCRLNILAVRSKGPAATDFKPVLAPTMIAAALLNAFSRKSLGLLFSRALFHDPRDRPPFFHPDNGRMVRTALTEENFRDALLASGSIPMVMPAVKDVAGAAPGLYRDGGVIDYHMDLPFPAGDGVTLFPHYTDRVIPGWFDKMLSWRRPSSKNMAGVLLVCPSREFVRRLPYGRIPDRNDFHLFAGKDSDRLAYWRKVIEASRRLADDFLEAVETGRVRTLVRPMKVQGGFE